MRTSSTPRAGRCCGPDRPPDDERKSRRRPATREEDHDPQGNDHEQAVAAPRHGRHRRRGAGCRPVRLGEGLGGDRDAIQARGGRKAPVAALETVHPGRGGRFPEAGRGLQRCDRRSGRGAEREPGRRAAEGLGCSECRLGTGHVLGPLLAALPVPEPGHGRLRRRRLPRQQVWRLGRLGGQVRQVRRQVDRHPGRLQRQSHQLPQVGDEGGRASTRCRRTPTASSSWSRA